MKCCFCKKDAGQYGNNAEPVMKGRCCNKCNDGIVIPIRLLKAFNSPLLMNIPEVKGGDK